MENDRAIAYSEVYTILSLMNQKYVDMIPDKIKLVIEREMDINYKPKINPDIPLINQKLNKRTYTILAMLNFNYWCETQEQKKRLIKQYKKNDVINEKIKAKNFSSSKIFDNVDTKIDSEGKSESIAVYNEPIFTKIKKWFRRNFQIITCFIIE